MSTDDPAGVPIVGPGTPYITPALLTSAVTGISWSTIPFRGASPEEQLAEQLNICARATSMVDTECNQALRATVDTETWTGPGDFRCQNQPTGVTRLLASRGPVTSIVSGQVSSAAAFPRSWSTIPANQFEPENPLIGVYGTSAPGDAGGGGQGILVAPGWVTWVFGRLSSRIQAVYINGWPHASLTVSAAVGDSTLHVDDITGWDGAAGTIADGGRQEDVSVTAVTPTTTGAISGPGTLTLASPVAYAHSRGVLCTTLPGSVTQASILYACAQALIRGATATTIQTISGTATGQAGGSPQALSEMAAKLIHPYKRVV